MRQNHPSLAGPQNQLTHREINLGSARNVSGTRDDFYSGDMALVCSWGEALTSKQVKSLYDSRFDPTNPLYKRSQVKSFYKFEDNLVDSTGKGRDLTRVGGGSPVYRDV